MDSTVLVQIRQILRLSTTHTLNVSEDTFSLHLLVPSSILLHSSPLYTLSFFRNPITFKGGTRWPSKFRHYATSQKVAGSILDIAIAFFINLILPAALRHWGRLSVYQK